MSAPSTDIAREPPLLRPYEWALLGSAYLSQCVAFSFFFVSLSTILRANGAELDQLSWVYSLGLVATLKFSWAPLMDRFGFGRYGHYGMWLVIMQACLILTLVLMAQLSVQSDAPLPWTGLIIGCFFMSFFTACQDIAADGLSTRLLGPRQRGLGNALQMACGTLGFMAGGGVLLMMYEHWGWRIALINLTVLNLITLLLALLYREPAHARPTPAGHRELGRYWAEIGRFWQQPDTGWAWFLLIIALQTGVFMAYSVLSPMLVDAGWSMSRIGSVVNIHGTSIGTVSMVLLGFAMRRWSAAVTLRWMVPAQLLAVVLMATPLLNGAGQMGVMLGVGGFMALYMPMGVLGGTLMMGRTRAHAPATDFAVQYSVYLGAGYAAGALGQQLAQRLGYENLLYLAMAFNALMVPLVPWLWRRANRQSADGGFVGDRETGQLEGRVEGSKNGMLDKRHA
ncbi:MAG: MFS transporter [Lautropia sp.]|nr:MFS transporter [Lautropia sp.]